MRNVASSALLVSLLALVAARPLLAQATDAATGPSSQAEALAGPLEGSSEQTLAAPVSPAPAVRILPRLTAGTRWLRTLSYSAGVDASVTRGESESTVRWVDRVEVDVEITLLAGSRRGPRLYDLVFRRVDQPGATEATRLKSLPVVGDHWRCEGDDNWVCTGMKGAVTPPFWLLPEWSAWWFEGRLGDDGAYTRVRGVAAQLGLPPESRARLTVRTAGSTAGRTELDLVPSGTLSIPVADDAATATLSGAGHLSADLDAGILPALSLQWKATAEGRLPDGHGGFRRAESYSLNWTEMLLPAPSASP